MPQPRFNENNVSGADEPPFTNRDDYFHLLAAALSEQPSDALRVLVFHGIGGIGKTRLTKELLRMLEGASSKATELDLLTQPDERDPLCFARLDFQETQLRANPPLALFTMRHRLSKRHGLRFPAFDFAYAEWWAKTNPNVPLATSEVPFLEEGDFLLECLTIAHDIPGIGLVTKIPALLKKLDDKFQDYHLKRRLEVLKGLSGMKSHEIEERLPYFWGLDLKEEIEREGRRVVLFLDSYEVLRDGRRAESQRHRVDAWVREWVAHPGVLWVISGRDQLYWHEVDEAWADVIEQHLVGDLSEPDMRRLLSESGLTDPALQDVIVATAKGVPYDLELALGIYRERLNQGETPVPQDFMGTPFELHERFFRYLDDDGLVRALELLAVPRTWDRTLYAALQEHFDPGFPLGRFDDLQRFAFVTQLEDETHALHERTREALHEHGRTNPEEVHHFLFEYHSARLESLEAPRDVAPAHERALDESFYHGQAAVQLDVFSSWFHRASQVFNDAASWRLLEGLYVQLLGLQKEWPNAKDEDPSKAALHLAATLGNLAGLHHSQGRYDISEPIFQRALDIREQIHDEYHPDVAITLNDLAGLYYSQGRYDEAEALYRRALSIREQALGKDHPDVAITLNNLAVLNEALGLYAAAESLYQRALFVKEQALGKNDTSVAATLNNLAVLYWVQDHYDAAEPLFQRALTIAEKSVGADHPSVAATLSNLAQVYQAQGRYDAAKPLYQRTLAIVQKTLGENHPHVANSLNNLAGLYQAQERYDVAEALYQRTLAILQETLSEDHPHVAATLNNLAKLYKAQGRYDEAEPLYERALSTLQECLGHNHPKTKTVRAHYEQMKRERDGGTAGG
jgi:tetratricopeptide (TPR) repeat protein